MISSLVPLLDEALRLWATSQWVYVYADIRTLSRLGRTEIPFEILELESDQFTLREIINGTPHRQRADDPGIGKSGGDILVHLLRVLAPTGLPEIRDVSKFRHFKSVSKNASRDNDGESLLDAIMDDPVVQKEVDAGSVKATLAFMCQMFSMDLKEKCVKSEVNCKNHCGTLCENFGLHGWQCFFDQVHEGAIAEASSGGDQNTFRYFSDSLHGKTTQETREDKDKLNHTMYDIIIKLFSPSSDLVNMAEGARLHQRIRIVWMNDRMGHQECVYMICVSQLSRRVTVVFRGTYNWSDVSKDVNFGEYLLPNPINDDYPGKTENIELHGGFSEYLFHRRVDTGRSKYDEIADKALEYGLEFGEGGFTLCATGHSLGGALASMFGFFASTDERFANNKNAVRVFSFASPIPGKISYAKAFQHQEYEKRLVHARIAVEGDMIPLARVSFDRNFAHVGYYIEIRRGDEEPRFKYLHDKNWWHSVQANTVYNAWPNVPFWYIKAHILANFPRYMKQAKDRIEDKSMRDMTLEEHYKKFVIGSQGKRIGDGPECIGPTFKGCFDENGAARLLGILYFVLGLIAIVSLIIAAGSHGFKMGRTILNLDLINGNTNSSIRCVQKCFVT